MHTPTTTTRENSGALAMISSITPGTPTHSKITGFFGPAPSRSAVRQTWCQGTGARRSLSMVARASSSAAGTVFRWPESPAAPYGESAAGSTTTSAPQAVASARRPAEKSLATTVRTPRALSIRITASPIGPQPITIATSRLRTSPRRTAWRPTAIGSVSAPRSGCSPFGTGSISDSSTTSCSA